MTAKHLPCLLSLSLLFACSSDDVTDQTPGDGDGDGDGDVDVDRPDAGEVLPHVIPSNAAELGELAETGLAVGPPNGTFDSDADCQASSVLGICEPVSGTFEVCVCRADEIRIGDLEVVGSRALAILAWRSVEVTGTLRLGAGPGVDGPGASLRYLEAATSTSGGAGGSHATPGGGGAADPFGDAAVIPLAGGMRGQDACNSRPGGGGGGALQITAGERVIVSGAIVAPGGGGAGGSSSGFCLGGAGGGSGGAVLLEAPRVEIPGMVAANGGGGGGGGSNEHGGGSAGVTPSGLGGGSGGQGEDDHGCPLQGFTSGGDGGAGASEAFAARAGQLGDSISGCLGGTTYVGAGGGGGGLGRVRVNTETGCLCDGDFSPFPSMGTLDLR